MLILLQAYDPDPNYLLRHFGTLGLILIALSVLPGVFYLLTMQKAPTLAGKEHRGMEPGMVWLMFIPLVGTIWQFFVVKHVSSAVKRWAAANAKEVGDGGWVIGLTACILFCFAIIPILGILAIMVGFGCWIIWWITIAKFNKLRTYLIPFEANH